MKIKLTNYVFSSVLFLFVAIVISCNDNTQKTPAKKDAAAYEFIVPAGWQEEKIAFPISFAPQIAYTGVENLRFMPGWSLTTSEEHWSYIFLWWLDGAPKADEQALQENLKVYYTGLVGRNIKERIIPADKVVPVVAKIKQTASAAGDAETYSGSIVITDYLDLQFSPITLNCMIHKRICGAHTALIVEISPKAFNHKNWSSLNQVLQSFKCGN
ncbi:MAG TPA: hypothetical protein PKM63_00020 [Panacibacter sp.]|nr:hypothetical protein [Panacibacter sp.]HNP42634.1 hypothetical protein [Panacibacter sp.]